MSKIEHMRSRDKTSSSEESNNSIGSLIARVPGGVLGGVGLVGLLSGVIDLHVQVQNVVDAYQMATRPIWEHSIGLLLENVGLRLPDLVKDYLTMGAIVSLSEFFAISGMLWKSTWRSAFRERLVSIFHVMFVDMHMQPIVTFLFWPITIVRTFTASRSNTSTSDLHEMSVGPLRSRKRGRAFYRSMRHYGAKHFFGFVVWGLISVMVSYGMLIVEEAGSISK